MKKKALDTLSMIGYPPFRMAKSNEDDNMISKPIVAAFRDSGMSIKELSERSGVGYASAHRFVTGDGDVITKTASKIARVLGLEMRPANGRKRPTKRKG